MSCTRCRRSCLVVFGHVAWGDIGILMYTVCRFSVSLTDFFSWCVLFGSNGE